MSTSFENLSEPIQLESIIVGDGGFVCPVDGDDITEFVNLLHTVCGIDVAPDEPLTRQLLHELFNAVYVIYFTK